MAASWDVIEHKATADRAFIVGRYLISKHSPESRSLWPTDALLQVAYSLAGRTLSMTITVSNPTAANLPYGFGIHPYFRLPFAPGGDPVNTQVILPASKYWVLEDFLPTGEIRPVDARLDFRAASRVRGRSSTTSSQGFIIRIDVASPDWWTREKGRVSTDFR